MYVCVYGIVSLVVYVVRRVISMRTLDVVAFDRVLIFLRLFCTLDLSLSIARRRVRSAPIVVVYIYMYK